MHYAAVAGEAGTVKLLLRYGARAGAESNFAETPLFIAQQNPAEFLGVDTRKVVSLLQSWESIDAKVATPNGIAMDSESGFPDLSSTSLANTDSRSRVATTLPADQNGSQPARNASSSRLSS